MALIAAISGLMPTGRRENRLDSAIKTPSWRPLVVLPRGCARAKAIVPWSGAYRYGDEPVVANSVMSWRRQTWRSGRPRQRSPGC